MALQESQSEPVPIPSMTNSPIDAIHLTPSTLKATGDPELFLGVCSKCDAMTIVKFGDPIHFAEIFVNSDEKKIIVLCKEECMITMRNFIAGLSRHSFVLSGKRVDCVYGDTDSMMVILPND